MKKSTLLAALAVFSLAACNGETGIPEGQGMTDLKAAQKVEHDKGNVAFDINGTFNSKVSIGDNQVEKIAVKGINGRAVFEQLPEAISDLSFNLIQKMNARLDIGAASIDIKYKESEEAHKTEIEMDNPSLTVGLNSNSAAFGITQGTVEGVYVDGNPIENPQDIKWKVDPWLFDGAFDFDLPYYDSSAFSTYAGVLFSFKKAGGYTRATMKMDYEKASQLYVGLQTALYMKDHPGDLSDAEYNKEVGNMQELFKDDIANIIDDDFEFTFFIDYEASRGINQFGIYLDGEIRPNYLSARNPADIWTIDLNLDLTFREAGQVTFEAFTGDDFVNVR